jgi:predicted kinase
MPDGRHGSANSILIVLSGLPGVGKTTIAVELARTLPAVHVRIDSIEHAIRQSASHASLPIDDAGYLVGYAIAGDNLSVGHTVVADSVNPWPETRDAWVAVARRAGVPALEIEIVCSNPDDHRRRVETRIVDLPGFKLPTWQDVVSRDYRPWARDRVVIDASRLSVAGSVDTIRRAVRSAARAT